MPQYSANVKVGGKNTPVRYHFEFSGSATSAKAALEQKFGKGNVVGGVSSHGISKPPSNATVISVP